MQWRKPSGPLGGVNGDGKGPESMNLNGSSNRSSKSQLSRSAFDGDLPNRHGTDEDLILRQGNGRVKGLRQFGIIRVADGTGLHCWRPAQPLNGWRQNTTPPAAFHSYM